MDQTMTLAGARHRQPQLTRREDEPRTRTRRRAAGPLLHGAGDVARWLLLAATAPELLIAEEGRLERELHDGERHDGSLYSP